MRFYYPKSVRLRSRNQFQKIARKHVRHVGQLVIIDARKTHYSKLRLGITVSRHYGGAVTRNRFKRVTREAFRLCQNEFQTGFDLNIKPRTAAAHAKPADIIAEIRQFFTHSLLNSQFKI